MSTELLTLEGNLGANPVMKETPSGKKVCNFSIATNEDWYDASNTKQKKTEWHTIECWNQEAIDCEQRLSKGSRVSITGTLKLSTWKDKEGNEKTSKVIQAKKIDLINFNTNESNSDIQA
jgi:single-strand DNA-binding protein